MAGVPPAVRHSYGPVADMYSESHDYGAAGWQCDA